MSRLTDLASQLALLHEKKETLEEHLKQVKAGFDEVEQDLLKEMAAEGIQNFDHDSGFKFVYTNPKYPRLADKMREPEMLEWLKANPKYAGIVREQVNPQTLKANLREMADDKVPFPDFIEIFEDTKIQMRRSKK